MNSKLAHIRQLNIYLFLDWFLRKRINPFFISNNLQIIVDSHIMSWCKIISELKSLIKFIAGVILLGLYSNLQEVLYEDCKTGFRFDRNKRANVTLLR